MELIQFKRDDRSKEALRWFKLFDLIISGKTQEELSGWREITNLIVQKIGECLGDDGHNQCELAHKWILLHQAITGYRTREEVIESGWVPVLRKIQGNIDECLGLNDDAKKTD